MRQPKEWASHWLQGAMKFSGINQTELRKRHFERTHKKADIWRTFAGKSQPRMDRFIELIEACGLEIVELKVKRRHDVA